MATIVVSGALANKPFNGGEAWVRLSWLLGLRRLGHRVCFLEEIDADTCRDAVGEPSPFACSANLHYFQDVIGQFGLAGRSALVCATGGQTWGLSMSDLTALAAEADLLVNISGHLSLPELFDRFRRKVYIDIDPGFTQFWHAAGNPGARLAGHDDFFTIGENIGAADCPIPTGGLPWRRTRQPVVLDHWPVSPDPGGGRFTTVASWRGPFGPVEFGGKTYRLKVHEFRKFLDLPRRVPAPFEVALHIHPADGKDLAALRESGWRVVDPRAVASDPLAFRRYVETSAAEFSVAQGVYVETNSGWFSDRSVRYLAAGKPVLVQDTGFSRNLPVGEGLLAFRTPDEAAAGAEKIVQHYDHHCRAARAIAEEHFDSDRILGRLLEEVGIRPRGDHD